jgi:hypothetical protein
MRWLVVVALAVVMASCAKKDRADPEKVASVSPAAPAGVCGPDDKPQQTACGETNPHDCNATCGCEHGGTKAATGPIRPVSEAKLGDRTRCLVTNTVFQVKSDSPSVKHDGKTYFFCCEGCAEKFKEAPAKFLGS